MKKGAWLVNTARGAIVDRDSLVKVMNDGHLGGYAGDGMFSPFEFHSSNPFILSVILYRK